MIPFSKIKMITKIHHDLIIASQTHGMSVQSLEEASPLGPEVDFVGGYSGRLGTQFTYRIMAGKDDSCLVEIRSCPQSVHVRVDADGWESNTVQTRLFDAIQEMLVANKDGRSWSITFSGEPHDDNEEDNSFCHRIMVNEARNHVEALNKAKEAQPAIDAYPELIGIVPKFNADGSVEIDWSRGTESGEEEVYYSINVVPNNVRYTLTVTFDSTRELTPEEQDDIISAVQVQVEEPMDMDGEDVSFVTSNIKTTIVTV